MAGGCIQNNEKITVMSDKFKFFILASAASLMSCGGADKTYTMGTYGYDLAFFSEQGIDVVELSSTDGTAKIMLIPSYQGRVMTSTTDGNDGDSYGWINYELIRSGEINPQFNPTGGEERFWIGPEGGPFSFYFKKGDEQIYANWKVPAAIDTDSYEIVAQNDKSVHFTKDFSLVNASDNCFDIGVDRSVTLLDKTQITEILACKIPSEVACVAYTTVNVITNRGVAAWTRETGMPSIWLLGMFNPTPSTTVFIPYDVSYDGKIVNDTYFGKIPSDRLLVDNGMAYFKIDGMYRSKLGLPAGSARDLCGSYDSEKRVLTVIKYSVPVEGGDYVNGQWGDQEDPFSGDVINSYNDGPTENGTIMGPFYEVETSSPGAALAPGESLTHRQTTIHFQGEEASIDTIVRELFGVELEQITKRFRQ